MKSRFGHARMIGIILITVFNVLVAMYSWASAQVGPDPSEILLLKEGEKVIVVCQDGLLGSPVPTKVKPTAEYEANLPVIGHE